MLLYESDQQLALLDSTMLRNVYKQVQKKRASGGYVGCPHGQSPYRRGFVSHWMGGHLTFSQGLNAGNAEQYGEMVFVITSIDHNICQK